MLVFVWNICDVLKYGVAVDEWRPMNLNRSTNAFSSETKGESTLYTLTTFGGSSTHSYFNWVPFRAPAIGSRDVTLISLPNEIAQ